MSAITTSSPRTAIVPKFHNGEDFLHSLGDIPLARVMFDPWPGTATEEDLLHFVGGDKLCELVEGTLVEKPVGYEESRIAFAIAFAVEMFVRPRKRGLVAWPDATLRMLSGSIRLPDVSFVSIEDLPGGRIPKAKVPTLPPTLAVEVVSESNTRAEMRGKIRQYFDSGSRLVWLVYPETKIVAVFEKPTEDPIRFLGESDILDGGTVLPGFSLLVRDIFKMSDIEQE